MGRIIKKKGDLIAWGGDRSDSAWAKITGSESSFITNRFNAAGGDWLCQNFCSHCTKTIETEISLTFGPVHNPIETQLVQPWAKDMN